MRNLEPVTITISGPHNTGRTTMGILFKMFLEENGFSHVQMLDTLPLPGDKKDPFITRFEKNRERPVVIQVVTEEK